MQIIKSKNFIEYIGHFDSHILCAKLTLLADLYAIEHRVGYAKFKIEDEDKLKFINDKLDYAGEVEPNWISIYIDDIFINNFAPKTNYSITSTGIFGGEGLSQVSWTASQPNFLGLSTSSNAIEPDTGYAVGDIIYLRYGSYNFYSVYGQAEQAAQLGSTLNNNLLCIKRNGVLVPVNASQKRLNNLNSIDIVSLKIIIPYLTFSSPNTFNLRVNDNIKHWDGTLEYSIDTINWSTWSGTTTIASSNTGDIKYLYLRGIDNTIITGDDWGGSKYPTTNWIFSGSNISCTGNIENLLDYSTVMDGEHPIMDDDCYNSLFYHCENLINAPKLPATALSNYCYYSMFEGCINLTSIPTLSAILLLEGCYQYMFKDCSKIKLSTISGGEYTQSYRIPTNGTGYTNYDDSLDDMFINTGGTFAETPEINTIYYLSNTNTIIRSNN